MSIAVHTADMQRVRRWRLRAEECRTLADSVTDPTSRSSLIGIADSYDRLAVQAETQPDRRP